MIKKKFLLSSCKLSNGFLEKFIKRNKLAQRRDNNVITINEDKVKEKIERFKMHLQYCFLKNPQIVGWCNFDETRVQLDSLETTTIVTIVTKTVQVKKSRDSIKQSYTVILGALNDGKKLPPMIIFNS